MDTVVAYGSPDEKKEAAQVQTSNQALQIPAADQQMKDRSRSISEIDPTLGERTEEKIDEDVYGATIFSVCYDLKEIVAGVQLDDLGLTLHVYRLCYVIMLLVGNYCLQCGLLYWIYSFVALPQVSQAQTVYRSFHLDVFVDGKFDDSLWRQYDRSSVCNICFSNFWFMYAILLLWFVNMLIELRRTSRLWRKIAALPSTSSIAHIIIRVDHPEPDVDHLNYIVRLTTPVRYLLYLLLLVPKMFIAVGLLLVGWIWLTATDSVPDLILNCVALGFVVNIDELLFEGLVPETMQNNIKITSLSLPGSAQDRLYTAVIHGYMRSTAIVLLVFVGTYMYMVYGQNVPVIGVFPGYSHVAGCNEYWMEKAMGVCTVDGDCFPKS